MNQLAICIVVFIATTAAAAELGTGPFHGWTANGPVYHGVQLNTSQTCNVKPTTHGVQIVVDDTGNFAPTPDPFPNMDPPQNALQVAPENIGEHQINAAETSLRIEQSTTIEHGRTVERHRRGPIIRWLRGRKIRCRRN